MLVRFTHAINKHEFYLRADFVIFIERRSGSLLETVITTSMMTPKGPLCYTVLETPLDAAIAVDAALAGARTTVVTH